MNNPLVTCLCLTRNRREWLPRAIACFEAQTYENRELLIVADGVDVADLVPADPRIRLLALESYLMVGEKRNFGCQCATGELIAHWDDDDHSSPVRLERQVRRLQETAKSVTGYHSMRFTNGSAWWMYTGSPVGFALGTSLCYLRGYWNLHPFEARQIGQDEYWAMRAAGEKQLHAVAAGGEMYASIHPANTCRYETNGNAWSFLPGFAWQDAK